MEGQQESDPRCSRWVSSAVRTGLVTVQGSDVLCCSALGVTYYVVESNKEYGNQSTLTMREQCKRG